jgi:hypothetical protein
MNDGWDELTAWFLAANLPAGPYRLNAAVVVSDQAKSHGWLRMMIERRPRGLVREALLMRLAILRELIGGSGFSPRPQKPVG